MKRTPRTRHLVTLALAGLAALALAACGGGGADSGAASSAGGASPMQRGVVGGAPSKGASGADSGGTASSGGKAGEQAADAVTVDQRIVRTADMTVRTKDVEGAVTRVHVVVDAAKGYVSDERTSTSPGGDPTPVAEGDVRTTQSVLTVRVPNGGLDRVMAEVGDLGTVLSRNQSSEDVTSQYVDTAARVRSQTASVDRVRALLAQATNLGQVVQIEGELARREADLDALEARLKALEDSTSLSTLTITLTAPVAAPAPQRHDNAFVAGLRSGWTALLGSLAVLLTVVGALLPFAVLVAAVGVPVLWWVRRQRRPQAPTPAA